MKIYGDLPPRYFLDEVGCDGSCFTVSIHTRVVFVTEHVTDTLHTSKTKDSIFNVNSMQLLGWENIEMGLPPAWECTEFRQMDKSPWKYYFRCVVVYS